MRIACGTSAGAGGASGTSPAPAATAAEAKAGPGAAIIAALGIGGLSCIPQWNIQVWAKRGAKGSVAGVEADADITAGPLAISFHVHVESDVPGLQGKTDYSQSDYVCGDLDWKIHGKEVFPTGIKLKNNLCTGATATLGAVGLAVLLLLIGGCITLANPQGAANGKITTIIGGVSRMVTASTTSFLCISEPGRFTSRQMWVMPAL